MQRDGVEASPTEVDSSHKETVEPPLAPEDGIWLKRETEETGRALHQVNYRGHQ